MPLVFYHHYEYDVESLLPDNGFALALCFGVVVRVPSFCIFLRVSVTVALRVGSR